MRLNQATAKNTPITMDQVRRFAPSVFAEQPGSGVSEKYSFIPTITAVDSH